MEPNFIASTLTAAALSLTGVVFAQSNTDQPTSAQSEAVTSFTHGESKRCESMSGSAKEACDREEAAKAEGSEADSANAARPPAGSSAAAGGSDAHFTHGESKRCETMTGAAKEQCDKQEATK
jgi:hypothetical protein